VLEVRVFPSGESVQVTVLVFVPNRALSISIARSLTILPAVVVPEIYAWGI
jgi:hypothetical protein